MLCFISFVVLIIEMELEKFKHTILPLQEKLRNIVCQLLDNRPEVDDVIQESFLKLWQVRDKLDEYRSIEAIAVTVTKNTALDFLKSIKPRAGEEALYGMIEHSGRPDEVIELNDTVAYIRQLISQLPNLQQITIRMKDIEGYEIHEIAEITNTSVETVRVNLSRARKKYGNN